MPAPQTLGVGFIGAGPVTQAIHLPTLARLPELFRVTHVMDVDAAVAQSVAARVGARHSTAMESVLADPDVDVVAVCSPHSFHAEAVIATCGAGKKAILCEKPFAMNVDDAARMTAVSVATGVPVVVGAMHTFDPGWQQVRAGWGTFATEAHTIRSSIVLPPNSRFEDLATEVITRPVPHEPDLSDPEVAAGVVHGAVLGLAVHDLPLVRVFLENFADLRVHSAHAIARSGYQISLTAGGKSVALHAAMTQTWRPDWTFQAWSDDAMVHIAFTPSYVQAGSAVSTFTRNGSSTTYGPATANGYETEWRLLADLAVGAADPPSPDGPLDDLRFAVAVADAAAAATRTAGAAAAPAGDEGIAR